MERCDRSAKTDRTSNEDRVYEPIHFGSPTVQLSSYQGSDSHVEYSAQGPDLPVRDILTACRSTDLQQFFRLGAPDERRENGDRNPARLYRNGAQHQLCGGVGPE